MSSKSLVFASAVLIGSVSAFAVAAQEIEPQNHRTEAHANKGAQRMVIKDQTVPRTTPAHLSSK
jgi:hypothetical protein